MEKKDNPLINSEYQLEKFPGKGGWTYAAISEFVQDKHSPFGWVKVKGSIDGVEIKNFKLMPMGNGKLFLPVKAAIRKKIGKEAGDFVRVILARDTSPVAIPDEMMACFENEPTEILQTFLTYSEGEQKAYLDWIYEAKTEETKANRIAKMLDCLSRNKKFTDKEDG